MGTRLLHLLEEVREAALAVAEGDAAGHFQVVAAEEVQYYSVHKAEYQVYSAMALSSGTAT